MPATNLQERKKEQRSAIGENWVTDTYFFFVVSTYVITLARRASTDTYVMKLSICYAHAKFWGNPSVFGLKITKQTPKTTYDKNFDCNFWKFQTI